MQPLASGRLRLPSNLKLRLLERHATKPVHSSLRPMGKPASAERAKRKQFDWCFLVFFNATIETRSAYTHIQLGVRYSTSGSSISANRLAKRPLAKPTRPDPVFAGGRIANKFAQID